MTDEELKAGVAARGERVAAIVEAYGRSACERSEMAEALKLSEYIRASLGYLTSNGKSVDDAIITMRMLAQDPSLHGLAPWDPKTGSRRPPPEEGK